jgi:DNA-binding MarR family transcriptional regulator
MVKKGQATFFTYTLKDIAEYIDMHYTTVSRAIKKIEREYER